MKPLKHIILLLFVSLGLTSCFVPKYATLSNTPNLSKYKYVYITPTSTSISVKRDTHNDSQGMHNTLSRKSFTPSDVIAGYFMKQGFIRVPEIREYQKAQTIVVNFGESGGKNYAYVATSTEVTIQVVDALTHEVLCTSTAEGLGETETDNIKNATIKCLDAIFR